MEVRVRFFAVLRERTGTEITDLELPGPTSVRAAWEALQRKFPELSPFANCVTFAVNREYVHLEHELAPGDELALIPPVSGGSGREVQ
ncbi:MAG: molybdopterin converting factor subunit 1 [Candidatus Binatia bacterium]|nr:molybdopterin converting factor subunit 1 [Candidatus Binatia bacterium]